MINCNSSSAAVVNYRVNYTQLKVALITYLYNRLYGLWKRKEFLVSAVKKIKRVTIELLNQWKQGNSKLIWKVASVLSFMLTAFWFLGGWFCSFCFRNGWDKEVSSARSLCPVLSFFSFYRCMFSIGDALANFLCFHFCRGDPYQPAFLLASWLRVVSCARAFVKSRGAENWLDWALGDHVQAQSSLHVVGAVLAAILHAVLTLWREGLDVFRTFQLFGDCT